MLSTPTSGCVSADDRTLGRAVPPRRECWCSWTCTRCTSRRSRSSAAPRSGSTIPASPRSSTPSSSGSAPGWAGTRPSRWPPTSPMRSAPSLTRSWSPRCTTGSRARPTGRTSSSSSPSRAAPTPTSTIWSHSARRARRAPELTLAANYWDEMGRGALPEVHTELHRAMADALRMRRVPVERLPLEALSRKALNGYLATTAPPTPNAGKPRPARGARPGPRCRRVVTAMRAARPPRLSPALLRRARDRRPAPRQGVDRRSDRPARRQAILLGNPASSRGARWRGAVNHDSSPSWPPFGIGELPRAGVNHPCYCVGVRLRSAPRGATTTACSRRDRGRRAEPTRGRARRRTTRGPLLELHCGAGSHRPSRGTLVGARAGPGRRQPGGVRLGVPNAAANAVDAQVRCVRIEDSRNPTTTSSRSSSPTRPTSLRPRPVASRRSSTPSTAGTTASTGSAPASRWRRG